MHRLLQLSLLGTLVGCQTGLSGSDEDDEDTDTQASDDTDTDAHTDTDTGTDCPTWYADKDEDGWGDPGEAVEDCDQPAAFVDNDRDCDDEAADIHPGSSAQVDGVDSNCNGRRDWLVDIWVSVDDAFELCVDHANNVIGSGEGWTHGFHFSIWLDSGPHLVGIEGWDLHYQVTAAIAHIEISDGTVWVTDDTWRYDPDPGSGSEAGWCGVNFDDSQWMQAVVHGPIGTDPWNSSCGAAPCDFPSGSPAEWIWDHFPVELNTQYLRKEIVLP